VNDQLCYVDPLCDDLNPEVTLSTPAFTIPCTNSPSKTASNVTTASTTRPSRGTAKRVSFNSKTKEATSNGHDDPDHSPVSKNTRRRSQPPASGRPTSPHTTCKERISKLEADNKQLFSIIAEMKKNQNMMDSRLQSQEEDGVDLQTLVSQIRGVEERSQAGTEATHARIEKCYTAYEKMNDCVTDVFERINTLQSDHEELEVRVNGLTAREKNLQAMEEQVAAITRRPYLLDTPPPSRLVNPDDSTLAFHITGIRNLQNGGQYDPVEVIKGLLYTVGQQFFYTRIQLVDLQPGEPRVNARSAIVHFTSNYHKNNTVVKIKAHLAGERIRDVAINDCFPKDKMEEVKLLKYYGGKLRHEGKVARTKLINRFGEPVLQSSEAARGRYRDTPVPASFTRAVMEAEIQQRTTSSRHRTAAPGGRSQPPPASGAKEAPPPLIDLTSGGPASKSPPPRPEVKRPSPTGRDQERGRDGGRERGGQDGGQEARHEDGRGGATGGKAPPLIGFSRGLHNGGERQQPLQHSDSDRSSRMTNGGNANNMAMPTYTSWSGRSTQQRRPVPPEHGGPRISPSRSQHYNNSSNNTPRKPAYFMAA